jgi:hypothetical protein
LIRREYYDHLEVQELEVAFALIPEVTATHSAIQPPVE